MFCDGYVTFGGIDCIYIVGKDAIKLIPTDEKNIVRLNDHFADQNFLFRFSDIEYTNCIAYIDRTEMNIGYALSLIPIYVFKLLNREPITTMEITGPSIDEIFHPASYYYFKAKSGQENSIDLVYDFETADKWSVTVDGTPVEISLQYGGILDRGIASDMKLHPKLVASFSPTTECGFLFKIYSAVTRFLQLTQYNSNYGECIVHLYGHIQEHNSGYLYDWKRVGTERSFFSEIEYRYIKPYIENMLQFSADNLDSSLDYLPAATYRWNRADYTPEILRSLFAAFESEYKKSEEIYGKDTGEDLGQIKEKTIQMISSFSKEALSDGEKNFLEQAKSRIQDIGNQPGQTRKMQNVINELSPVLNKCAEHLFIRSRIGSKDGFSSKEIKQIVGKIVGMRALVSHTYTLEKFDDIQAEYIHFLEILVHAQMLKRAGIDDDGIVLIIGLLFHCNSAHMDLLSKWAEERPQ